MPTMSPVPDNHPLMIAWKSYQETEEFANTLRWYGKEMQDPEGTLWAAFMAGFNSGRKSAAEIVQQARHGARDTGLRSIIYAIEHPGPDEITEA